MILRLQIAMPIVEECMKVYIEKAYRERVRESTERRRYRRRRGKYREKLGGGKVVTRVECRERVQRKRERVQSR